ncbi:MAG: hypothetical protein AB3N24_06030 [Leisingera sp.]
MMRCIDHPAMVKDSSSWGALTGISAADLAEDGFTGAPALTVEAPEVADIWSDLGSRWRILESNFKAFPVCRWAHPPIEAVLSLVSASEIPLDEIVGITVSTFHEATRLTANRPANSDTAQYSLPLAVALALRFGTILPEHLSPDHYGSPDIWRLADLVSFEECEAFNAAFPAERYAKVTLKLKNGEQFTSETKAARGNHDAPLTDQELIEKLELYASPVCSPETRASLASILMAPANAPSPAEIVGLLQTSQSGGTNLSGPSL